MSAFGTLQAGGCAEAHGLFWPLLLPAQRPGAATSHALEQLLAAPPASEAKVRARLLSPEPRDNGAVWVRICTEAEEIMFLVTYYSTL